jgi:hypothetical protein
MVFEIPATTQNITYRAMLKALDEIGTGVLRMQSELADGPSASLPAGFQDQDEIDDLEKNLKGIHAALDGVLAQAKAAATMRIDRSKM